MNFFFKFLSKISKIKYKKINLAPSYLIYKLYIKDKNAVLDFGKIKSKWHDYLIFILLIIFSFGKKWQIAF